jgi:hypothetical protein
MTTTETIVTEAMARLNAEWRSQYGCPYWCELDPGTHDITLAGNRAVVDHDGPEFGRYITAGGVTYAETGEVASVDVHMSTDLGSCEVTPGILRQLAADALAAAEWLEAQA